MAEETVSVETNSIHSEEDLQRLIELETWSDFDTEERRVEDDSRSDEHSYGEQEPLNVKLLWSEDERREEDGSSSATQPPRVYSDIVKELLTQLDEVERGPGNGSSSPMSEGSSKIERGTVDEQAMKPEKLAGNRIEDDSGGVDVKGEMSRKTMEETSPCMGHDNEATLSSKVVIDEDFPFGGVGREEKPKYYYIAHEILTSERTYVRDLRVFEKVIHGTVKTKATTDKDFLPESTIKEIFLNIGEIYVLHFDLLKELEDTFKQWDANTAIAKVIASRGLFFKLYTDYSEKYRGAQATFLWWMKTSKEFKKLIEIVESHPFCNGIPVTSFLLLPIQRIPRNKLLLKEYLKSLPRDHPDLENTKAALTIISEVSLHMERAIADLESEAVMYKIQLRFVGQDVMLAPGRKFIGRGQVTFAPLGRRVKRVLFLFSDSLLVASSTADMKYRKHNMFYLKNILIKALPDISSVKNGFCIAVIGTREVYRFYTDSRNDRDMWVKRLKKAQMANSEYFTVDERSKYAKVLYDRDTFRSILAVLNDPAFEFSQPSWVRRSKHSASKPAPATERVGSSTSAAGADQPAPEIESVDKPIDSEEDIETEFEDEEPREKDFLTMDQSLKPGMDNSLSSYMLQKSAKGGYWKRRWFVLTSRALVAYKDHSNDESMGAIPLSGYKVSRPTDTDGMNKKAYIFKLTHLRSPGYFFELPNFYAFEKWYKTLNELLDSDVNS